MKKSSSYFVLAFLITNSFAQEINKETILLSVLKQHTIYSLSYENLFNEDYSYDIGVFPIRINENIFPNTTIAIKRHFTKQKRYHIGLGTTFYEDATLFQLLLGIKSSLHLRFRMQIEFSIGLGNSYNIKIHAVDSNESGGGASIRVLPSLGLGYSF